jgi:hypothetical protein
MRQLVVLLAFASASCAMGNRHSYSIARPELAPQGTRAIVVAAQDARSYVVSGEKTPDYVGTQRGGFGNPFNVLSQSGKPLAEDFAATIAESLGRKGFKLTTVKVAVSDAPNIRALAAQAGSERVALVLIHEWKSDTYQNTALSYDVSLQVYDAAGSRLAVNRITGRDDLGGSAFNPPSHARTAVPVAYKKKLEDLFAADAVVKSLR